MANHRGRCRYTSVSTSSASVSRGRVSLACTTPDQFRTEVAWPGDWPEAQAGEALAGAPDDAEEARMDEEMTDLLDFLGGSGAM